jgi:hypothetical protein
MANWVYIEDNEIIEYHDQLPKSWRNVSGLHLLANNVPALVPLGWYPVTKEPETYNPDTSYLNGYTYTIGETSVTQHPVIVDYTEAELEERLTRTRDEFFSQLRNERNQKLTASDWTQTVDIQELQTVEWITAWKTYRQALRDLPQTYVDTTAFDMSTVVWPAEPEA